jgi:hypothetical protein
VVPPGGRYRLTGVVPDYPAPGNTWFTLDADALSDYLVGSRDIQHRVDEEVAQSLAMLGEEAAHTLAQSLTREHGYQPPRGGVGGTPVREPGLATDRGISSPVLGTSRNSNAGAVMPGRNDYIRVRALSPETQKRLYDAIREVSAAAGPGSMSLRQIGKAAVARLRREGVISDRTRGSYLMSHHLNSALRNFVDLKSLNPVAVWHVRQRYLALRAAGVKRTDAVTWVADEMRAQGVIPASAEGRINLITARRWEIRAARSVSRRVGLAGAGEILPAEAEGSAPGESADPTDLVDLDGTPDIAHGVVEDGTWQSAQQGLETDQAGTAQDGGPWQDVAFDALRGAGSGEEYLQVDSTVVQAADPTAASVVQDGWSVVSPSQEGSGSPENRWQQVEAALSAGLLTPERVIAARVHESVFVPLPLLPGWDMAALLEARLESGQPFFGSVHLDRVAAGGQVLVTFPAGSGYDLGLLGGGGPDGVVVVPPGGRYRLTGVVPDYPAPGNTWFFLAIDPSQG